MRPLHLQPSSVRNAELTAGIVQEIFFLHERGRKLAWFIFIECVAQGIFFVVSTYMTSAWGWRWWYDFFTVFNAIILLLSLVFVTETLFDRPEDASTGAVDLEFNEQGDLETGGEIHKIIKVTTAHGVVLSLNDLGRAPGAMISVSSR
ncbi:hypothetical protein LTR17_019771 [Elasticomyces elasticus]|nr:hypothetical protein LTR17_019771 [Elasticomyces elasticus]